MKRLKVSFIGRQVIPYHVTGSCKGTVTDTLPKPRILLARNLNTNIKANRNQFKHMTMYANRSAH